MLLDPKTYAYLGDRLISIKDQALGSKGEPKVLVKKGTLQHERLRTAVGMVTKPGRRRRADLPPRELAVRPGGGTRG